MKAWRSRKYVTHGCTSLCNMIWASSRENLSSVFPTKRVSNQSTQLQRLAKNWNSPVTSLHIKLSKKRITKVLIRLRRCAGWSAPLLFANLRRQVVSRRGPSSNYSRWSKIFNIYYRQKWDDYSWVCFFFCLIWLFTSQSTIFQLYRERSSWVDPVQSKYRCVLLKHTTQWGWWGANPQLLVLKLSILPPRHWAPYFLECVRYYLEYKVYYTYNLVHVI